MPAKQTVRRTSQQLVRYYLEVCYGSFVTIREIGRDTFSIYVVSCNRRHIIHSMKYIFLLINLKEDKFITLFRLPTL